MSKKIKIILLLIIVLASFLRLFQYDFSDVINDEVFYGYRSIGLIDSLNSPFQPTPFEWYDEVPAWAKVSFHDHPPLGFWIQHFFFSILGVSLLALRLPFIIAGVLSVFLTFAIAKQLFSSEKVGLVAGLILSVTSYHVWVSRIGLQESLLIFFVLLATWLFLKTLSDKKYFYWTVFALGLAILMKYTAVVLAPIFIIYLFWKRRELLTRKKVVLSTLLLLIILSPVIIYNIGLYQARGHFDFQVSFFLGQNVPEWEVRPGREVGSFVDRVPNFVNRFWQNSGIVFSVLSVFGILALLTKFRKRSVQFLGLALTFLILLILGIGPQERFLAMLTPWLAVLIAAALVYFLQNRKILYVVLAGIIILELGFTVNSYYPVEPKGREGVAFSRLRRDAENWGYNQLEDYLQREMAGFYPEGTFPLRFSFAQRLQTEAIEKAVAEGKAPRAVLFVVDSEIHGMSSLWYTTRRSVYDGWPMISDQTYSQALLDDPDIFQKQGVGEIVYIQAEETLLRPDAMDIIIDTHGVEPILINRLDGATAFKVYKF